MTRHIQRVLQRIRVFDRRRPLVWNLLFTTFFVIAAIIDYGAGGWKTIAANADVPEPLVFSMSLGLSVPLLWRRSHPMPVLCFMTAVALVNSLVGAMLQASLLMLFLLFNVALRKPLKTLGLAALLVIAPIVVGTLRFPKDAWDSQLVPAFWSIALVALLGIAVRTRRDYTGALEDRAHRLEIERDQQAQLAAAAERTRIAREMHDIIGHNLSVITGLADGGAYAARKNPERAVQALEAIGTTSRGALTELRRLLDVLREESPAAELAPAPALSDLDSLIEGVRSAGLPVRTTVKGSPAALPPGMELSVYRVIQEALTNTLKHGGPSATSDVLVSYATDAVTVTVTDTGRGGTPDPDGTGRGLAGMRERTALYQGTLEAGPRSAGGWRVHLRIPIPPTPPSPSPTSSPSPEGPTP
nr:histidine kinase [Streptomyces mesophilus]